MKPIEHYLGLAEEWIKEIAEEWIKEISELRRRNADLMNRISGLEDLAIKDRETIREKNITIAALMGKELGDTLVTETRSDGSTKARYK